MTRATPLRKLLPLLALLAFALAMPSTASAQATRTWVSGVGDDVNPCSRTAPCKTWAGAISKTAQGGEINAIDAGGFGALHITKSITIDGNGTHASILACGTNGVIANPPAATDKVILRDLRINGCARTSQPGVDGVRHLRGSLRIEDSRIFGFTTGVRSEPDQLKSRMVIEDTRIYDNSLYGAYIRAKTGGDARATLQDTRLDDNGNGLVVSSVFGPSRARLFDSLISDSGLDLSQGWGVSVTGGSASVRIGDSRIVGNTDGLRTTSGGALISYGGNIVDDNTNDGNFTSNVARK